MVNMKKCLFMFIKDENENIVGTVGIGGKLKQVEQKDVNFWIKHFNGVCVSFEERYFVGETK